MISSSTITTEMGALTTTLGTLIEDNIWVFLGLAVLLIGAGFLWSRFKKHVHGRKI